MRPPLPVPLTFEEHQELGREMRKIRVRMHELRDLLQEVYGPNNRAAFEFNRAASALDTACRELQTQVETDAPGAPVDGIYVV